MANEKDFTIRLRATGGDQAAAEVRNASGAVEDLKDQAAGADASVTDLRGSFAMLSAAFAAAASVARTLWDEWKAATAATDDLVDSLRTLGVENVNAAATAERHRAAVAGLTSHARDAKAALDNWQESTRETAQNEDEDARRTERRAAALRDLARAQVEADMASGKISQGEGIARIAGIDAEAAQAKQKAAEDAASRDILAARNEVSRLAAMLADARAAAGASPDSSKALANAQGRLSRSQNALGDIGMAASYLQYTGVIATGDTKGREELMNMLGGRDAARELVAAAAPKRAGAAQLAGIDPADLSHDIFVREEIVTELARRAEIEKERSERARDDIEAEKKLIEKEREARQAVVRDLEKRAADAARDETAAFNRGRGVLADREITGLAIQAAGIRSQTRIDGIARAADGREAAQQAGFDREAGGLAARAQAALDNIQTGAGRAGLPFNANAKLVQDLITAVESLGDGVQGNEAAQAANAVAALQKALPERLNKQEAELSRLRRGLETLASQVASARSFDS